jgi:methylglyoxal synthase
MGTGIRAIFLLIFVFLSSSAFSDPACLKVVALIANDGRKAAMMKMVEENVDFFKKVKIVATEKTGEILKDQYGMNVQTVRHGPSGGDIDIAHMVSNKQLDAVFFFKDPTIALPHEADIQMMVRSFLLADIPFAPNPQSGYYLIEGLKHRWFSRP